MKINSLLGKILLALLTSTMLALLLVSIIQRYSMKQGFNSFLQQQEETQLSYLVPEVQQWYRNAGSWEQLRGNTRRWLRLLARARPEGISPPEDAHFDSDATAGQSHEASNTSGQNGQLSPPSTELRHQPRRAGRDPSARSGPPDELRRLWRRIFLLDAERQWVAGVRSDESSSHRLQPLQVDGAIVGWIGFVAANQPAAPEARRFLVFQRNTLLVSAGIALLASILLGFLLARHLTRPVEALRSSVQALTAGDFGVRIQPQGQDEIASLARHINRLAETLQANESARRRWTADVAHELRTPIAILQAEIEAARDGVRPNMETTLSSLYEEVAHLAALVNDLQSLALADVGALNMRLSSVDLAALLRQVLEALQERMKQAGLEVEVKAPPQLVVQADPQRMRQLLLNLLDNSSRYTDQGGRIRIDLQATPHGAQLTIADSAPGLDPEQRERLFERFYRADSSRNRAGGGSGLGLAICREIVLAHGGEIRAQASELGGLTIRVNLPSAI